MLDLGFLAFLPVVWSGRQRPLTGPGASVAYLLPLSSFGG
jgi:hypothetical protein